MIAWQWARHWMPFRVERILLLWFYGETESSDDVEALTIRKFRGDLAYRRQEYQKALQEYSSISEKLPPTNVAMKRDVQEGQARCLAHLGRHAEALAIATNLLCAVAVS
ncbi:PREDICTED: zinc fingers and homeoboxes protein 1, isoform 2-like isoform X2 [Myotis brandtii]|uniref:zinc fingers and homeoboxes protein 1, isoform 2-like isoform X2 n=1 Tax=Myotis brandtii TaxID=109478 RepID=UPI0007042B6F|nr:PREDICTED: zinc fingers and homeoboxes protein 1, isoform 2-like isoform X2 [Myotis brandtii]